MRLLLLSNSTLPGLPYLAWPKQHIQDFFKNLNGHILFIPFAGVSISYDRYFEVTEAAFKAMGLELRAIHKQGNMVEAIKNAAAIAVGGGNTFHLVKELHDNGLMAPLREVVRSGKPFAGWSAGSNVACPSLRTTNDMPIVEPPSFEALNLVDFQINAHYTDKTIEGHGGESRDQRLAEFLVANPEMQVIGLPEGSLIRVEQETYSLVGAKGLLFEHGQSAKLLNEGDVSDFIN